MQRNLVIVVEGELERRGNSHVFPAPNLHIQLILSFRIIYIDLEFVVIIRTIKKQQHLDARCSGRRGWGDLRAGESAFWVFKKELFDVSELRHSWLSCAATR